MPKKIKKRTSFLLNTKKQREKGEEVGEIIRCERIEKK